MEPGQAIRAGIAASAIAHLSVLMLVLLFSEVHPFGSATADPVAVNIVTSEEVAEKKPEPVVAPETKPAFDLPAPLAAFEFTGTRPRRQRRLAGGDTKGGIPPPPASVRKRRRTQPPAGQTAARSRHRRRRPPTLLPSLICRSSTM